MGLGFVDGYVVEVPDGTSTTITGSGVVGGTTYPVMVLGYETDREGRNIVHDLIGGGVAVALIAPRPRSGELRLLYASEALALAAVSLHANETTFTLTNTDRPAIGMAYVVNGSVRLELDPQTRRMWTVTVPYQEVEE